MNFFGPALPNEQSLKDRERCKIVNGRLADWLASDLNSKAYSHLQIQCIWQYVYLVRAFLLQVDRDHVNTDPTYELLARVESKLSEIKPWQ